MRPRAVAAALCAGLALTAGVRARAADEPQSVEAAIRAVHEHVAAERWKEAEAAVRRVFADHEGDVRVRARLSEIEDDLQVSLFRQRVSPPEIADLFGPALKTWNASTRWIELEYAAPTGPHWDVEEGRYSLFRPRFHGDAAIEFTPVLDDWRSARRLVAMTLFDPERAAGYVAAPYLGVSEIAFPPEDADASVVAALITPTGLDRFVEKGIRRPESPRARISMSRVSGAVSLKVGSRVVFAVAHGRARGGLVGVFGAPIKDVRIRGRLDPTSYRRLVADRLAAEFRRFKDETYDRTREIPAWARFTRAEDSDDLLGRLPADARFLSPEQTDEVVRLVLRGDRDGSAWGLGIANLSEPRTAAYFRGLVAFSRGEWTRSLAEFETVLAAEPEFGPARLFRGLDLAELRRPDEARTELEAVVAAHPNALRAHLGLARLCLDRGEFDRAFAHLSDVTSRGGFGEELDSLSRLVNRGRLGPQWTRRFRRETANFIVESDFDEKTCADVAALLEKMQATYSAALGPAPSAPSKARVYVFASEDGYRRHVGDLGADSESTAGMYLPLLRTLCLFVPSVPAELDQTVRHEAFHQYLHRMLPRAPAWFDEGWAQAVQGDDDSKVAAYFLSEVFLPRFVPLRDLVALDHRSFMRNADVNYAQSKSLVKFLLATRDKRFSGLLRAYLAELRGGASQHEANEKVLGPVMAELEKAFRDSLK